MTTETDKRKLIEVLISTARSARVRVRSAPDMMTAQCCADNNKAEMFGCYRKGMINLSEQLRIFGIRPVVPEVQDFHVNEFISLCF